MLPVKAWSETDFEDGALKLVQVLLEMENQSSSFDSPWSFRNGCLEATVTTVSRESDSAETLRTVTGTGDCVEVDDETCLWQDSDVVVPTMGAVESSLQRQGRLQLLRWTLSAVYSHVWHVPVLYFTVQRDNGAHVTRQELLTELRYYQSCRALSSGTAADSAPPLSAWTDLSWEFCSYEPHPVTGMPSFMVHPCQTKECLQVLRTTTTTTTTRRDGHCSNVVALDLWSWLSWILPSIGVSVIAPHTFQRVCRILSSSSSSSSSADIAKS
jgi:Autophagocytosis associated protein, active-site domain